MSTLENIQIVPQGLYRFNHFSQHIGVPVSTWYFFVKEGRAPKPAVQFQGKSGTRATRSLWRGADLINWLEDPVAWAENHGVAAAEGVSHA